MELSSRKEDADLDDDHSNVPGSSWLKNGVIAYWVKCRHLKGHAIKPETDDKASTGSLVLSIMLQLAF